jgi:hypothetical protein
MASTRGLAMRIEVLDKAQQECSRRTSRANDTLGKVADEYEKKRGQLIDGSIDNAAAYRDSYLFSSLAVRFIQFQ